jgi:hypothetical protein
MRPGERRSQERLYKSRPLTERRETAWGGEFDSLKGLW